MIPCAKSSGPRLSPGNNHARANPGGGWLDLEEVAPQPVQICLSVGRLVHDDDSVKIIAGSAIIVGDDQRVLLSGVIEIPARCVVSIVRLEERVE